MPRIHVYSAADSQSREEPVFTPTTCAVGTADEYQFYRAMDLLEDSRATAKLFFWCEEDYMHYLALRATLTGGGAFDARLASIQSAFPRTGWTPHFPHECAATGANSTNQFPGHLRTFVP